MNIKLIVEQINTFIYNIIIALIKICTSYFQTKEGDLIIFGNATSLFSLYYYTMVLLNIIIYEGINDSTLIYLLVYL